MSLNISQEDRKKRLAKRKKQREYRKKNKDKIAEYKKKYKSSPHSRLGGFKKRINKIIRRKKWYQPYKPLDLIGCDKELFNDWINYNIELDCLEDDYHIDHIYDLSQLNFATSFDDVYKINHWTNLFPLSTTENIKKSNKEPTKHYLFKTELRLFLFNKIRYIQSL